MRWFLALMATLLLASPAYGVQICIDVPAGPAQELQDYFDQLTPDVANDGAAEAKRRLRAWLRAMYREMKAQQAGVAAAGQAETDFPR